MDWAERANLLAPSLPQYNHNEFFLLVLNKGPCICLKVGSVLEFRARINTAVASVTLQTLENTRREIEYRSDISELQMTLTLRSTELCFLFEVKKTNFLNLVYSVFCVYLKCSE
jgi:hypothetical protein